MARCALARSTLYLLLPSACLLTALLPILRHLSQSPSPGGTGDVSRSIRHPFQYPSPGGTGDVSRSIRHVVQSPSPGGTREAGRSLVAGQQSSFLKAAAPGPNSTWLPTRTQCVGGGEDPPASPASLAAAARYLNHHVKFPGRNVCGPWSDSYAALHQQLISGRLPSQSFLVFQGAGGLGDRFTGLVTSFLLALTSSRALIIEDDVLPLAFDPAEVDWAYQLPESVKPLKPPYIKPNEDVPFELIDFLKTDASDEPAIVLNTNRGLLLRLFREQKGFAAQVLEGQYGMSPVTAHGCILRFLLKPKAEALSPIQSTVAQMIAPDVRTLGVHLRIEDKLAWDVAGGGGALHAELASSTLQLYHRYTQCAERISRAQSAILKSRGGAFARGGLKGLKNSTKIKWLFLSNFEPIVATAEQDYCGRVIRDPNPPRHVLYTKDEDDRKLAVLSTVSAWILLSLCNSFLISDSGFSRTSVAYSIKERSIYEVSDSWGHCSSVGFASLANRWSGL